MLFSEERARRDDDDDDVPEVIFTWVMHSYKNDPYTIDSGIARQYLQDKYHTLTEHLNRRAPQDIDENNDGIQKWIHVLYIKLYQLCVGASTLVPSSWGVASMPSRFFVTIDINSWCLKMTLLAVVNVNSEA